MYVRVFLIFLITGASTGTQISLRTTPGTLFSIPLEFSRPKFSADAPQWVKYEGGNIKGIGGDELGFYKFVVSELDGTEEVNVVIGISPRDSGACFHQKYFGRNLNLHEKITYGIPGGFYTEDEVRGTILHYPSLCHGVLEKNRRARASGHERKLLEDNEDTGSGDEFDGEEDRYENYDEDAVHEIERPLIPLQPTPTLAFYHPVEETDSIFDEIVSSPITQSTPITDFPLHSLPYVPSDLNLIQEYGSGDFDVEATTPTPVTPSATPIVELTPTLPPDQPTLRKQIQKLNLPAGKVFKFNVGKGYFTSPHPITYYLEETEQDSEVPDWLSLEDGLLVAWPSVADASDYRINLVARDTVTNGFTTNEIFLSVRESSKSRNYNHEFELKILPNISHSNPEPLYSAIERLQGFAGGRGEMDLVVLKIDRSASPLISIRWTNESLLFGENQHRCPEEELREIYLQLVDHSGSSFPSAELIKELAPSYLPKEVALHLRPKRLCAGSKHSNITGFHPVLPTRNFPPKIQRQLNLILTTSGQYFIQKVPETFCYDPEDGETPFLKLSLVNREGAPLPDNNWLQFDEKNQEFFGLPPPLPSGKPQIEEYTLRCMDRKGKTDNDALEVEIHSAETSEFAAEFRLHFQSAPFNPPEIKRFMEKLSKSLNESLTEILVISYQTSGKDVQFLWNLKRNPSTEAELTSIRRILLSDDGSLSPSFRDSFKPEFNLTFGQIVPKGRLLGGNTQTHEGDKAEVGVTEGPIFAADDTRAYMITYIIPAVLIGVMVILALLLACLLSRKRKQLPQNTDEARAFIKKGVPIIFQDELEEDKGARSRSPAILREEHPPLPPEYRRSPIQSYQPPPPVGRTAGSRSGVRPGTHYRKPPPYLPQ